MNVGSGEKLEKCMKVQVKVRFENGVVSGLIDTGYAFNMMYEDEFKHVKGNSRVVHVEACSSIAGVGNQKVPIVAEVRMNVDIKGVNMKVCVFYVMPKKSERDGVILG